MLFAYLNLPQLPKELETLCLKNIDLIDVDPKLNELNKLEGIGHSITYLPTIVKMWISRNVIEPNFNVHSSDLLAGSMLHVSHYIKHPEGTGVHPTHIDYGREYAINYIIDTGGDDVTTYWTTDDRESVIFEKKIEPRRWHVIKVNPAWHGVRGIKIGKLRSIISLCFNPKQSINIEDYFKNTMV